MALTKASPTAAAVEAYVAEFARFESEHPASPWLSQKRREAISRFQELGFPTVRDEEWKYTDITPAANLAITPIFKAHLNGAASQIAQSLPFANIAAHRLVFVNGHYAPELSQLTELPAGVVVEPLSEALKHEGDVVKANFGKIPDVDNETFLALNTAFAQDGAFVHVSKDVEVDTPIQLIFLSHSEGANVSHPRNMIVADAFAKVTVIETYASTSSDDVYFTNAITEVVAGNGATVEHIKLQTESDKAFHVGGMQIAAARDSNFRSHNVNLGGRLVRNNAVAVMGDENCEVTLNGLVVGKGDQHVDNHTIMDHAMPHCLSHENYAHVMDDNSNGVFNGKIFVRLDAQKTDAKQSNRTLLLSPNAQVNAKPQLEIFADDVKCTHGATIGQLDDDALFYLRARGIPTNEAKAILIRAFANASLDELPVEDLKESLEGILFDRLR